MSPCPHVVMSSFAAVEVRSGLVADRTRTPILPSIDEPGAILLPFVEECRRVSGQDSVPFGQLRHH